MKRHFHNHCPSLSIWDTYPQDLYCLAIRFTKFQSASTSRLYTSLVRAGGRGAVYTVCHEARLPSCGRDWTRIGHGCYQSGNRASAHPGSGAKTGHGVLLANINLHCSSHHHSMAYLGRIWWKLLFYFFFINFILKMYFLACAYYVFFITDQFWIK